MDKVMLGIIDELIGTLLSSCTSYEEGHEHVLFDNVDRDRLEKLREVLSTLQRNIESKEWEK